MTPANPISWSLEPDPHRNGVLQGRLLIRKPTRKGAAAYEALMRSQGDWLSCWRGNELTSKLQATELLRTFACDCLFRALSWKKQRRTSWPWQSQRHSTIDLVRKCLTGKVGPREMVSLLGAGQLRTTIEVVRNYLNAPHLSAYYASTIAREAAGASSQTLLQEEREWQRHELHYRFLSCFCQTEAKQPTGSALYQEAQQQRHPHAWMVYADWLYEQDSPLADLASLVAQHLQGHASFS